MANNCVVSTEEDCMIEKTILAMPFVKYYYQ